MPTIQGSAEVVSTIAEILGVMAILAGMVVATYRAFANFSSLGFDDSIKPYRQELGRAILLGLEFLVAGDIIRTVAVDPSLQASIVLGLIVLIRTFLSMSLQVELEGRWPWQMTR